MAERIKGQEIEILLIQDGATVDSITTIHNFEWTHKTEVLQEGYLGETTDRYDTLYRGVEGKFEMHVEDANVFDFIQGVINSARRRVPGARINVKGTMNFPSGQRRSVIIPNVAFGNFPQSFPDRGSYLNITVNFSAQEALAIIA